MAFNFKQYTANNPLLKEMDDKDYTSAEEFDYMSDDQLDAAGLTGDKIGPDEGASSFPRVEFEEAVMKALKAGIDKNTLHKIIDWN
jgi:hypothetical protein